MSAASSNSEPAKEEEAAAPPTKCDNCAAAATVRFTPLDDGELECCGECLLPDEGVLTLCKATCPNFAFIVSDFNAAGTEATAETDDHLECAQCGQGSHCVRAPALANAPRPRGLRAQSAQRPNVSSFPRPLICPLF